MFSCLECDGASRLELREATDQRVNTVVALSSGSPAATACYDPSHPKEHSEPPRAPRTAFLAVAAAYQSH